MVQKHQNWFKTNIELIGLAITLVLYGAGLYQAMGEKVSANVKDDAVQQEQINNLNQEVSTVKTSIKDYDTILRRIDKNVSEINVELKHKKDKGDK